MTHAENRHNGGIISRDKFLAKDPDYYSKIGKIGGKLGRKEHLANHPEIAASIGAKGGKKSKRGYKLVKETSFSYYYEHKLTGQSLRVRKQR